MVAAVCAPLFGKLGDRRGKRRMLLEVLVVYMLGSIGATFAPDIWALIGFRALQGVAGAVFPLAQSIVRDELPEEDVGRGIGALTAAFGVGAILSFSVSGVLTDALSWRLIFAVGALTVLVSIVAVATLVPDSGVRSKRSLDLPGIALLGGGLVALLVAITEGPAWGWTAAPTALCLAAALALLAAWARHEARTEEPLLDVSVLRSTRVVLANAATFAVSFSMFGIYVLLPHLVEAPHHVPRELAPRLHYGFGAGVVGIGLFLVPQAVGLTIAGPLGGRLARSGSGRLPLGGGVALVAVGVLWLALAHGSRFGVGIALFVAGLGYGAVIGAAGTVITRSVGEGETGVATGLNSDLRLVGGGLGGQLAAALMTALALTPEVPRESAFAAGFWMLAGVAVVGALCGAGMPASRRR